MERAKTAGEIDSAESGLATRRCATSLVRVLSDSFSADDSLMYAVVSAASMAFDLDLTRPYPTKG